MPDLSHTSIADHNAFEERFKLVPQSPGVYLWKDATGKLLYVGKSKSLRDRMRSYLGSPRGLNGKTRRMVSHIADFDIIVTQSELEALLLEMNLIKQHRPRYNILLKDDKTYPYIKITLNDPWPRVTTTRKIVEDGARYFGPYASAGSVYKTLDLLNRLFAFRPPYDCKDEKFNRHRRMGRPCLYHDMRRCLGPCVPGLVSQEEYHAAIVAVCRFLEGKSEQIARDIRKQMQLASEELNFERAAYLRDRLKAIEKVLEKQQVLRTVDTDQDVIAFAREEGSAVVQVLFIRGGKLVNAEPFTLQGTEDESDAELLASFITQFYDTAPNVPPTLLLAEHVEEPMIIERWLAQKSGHKVEVAVPRRGEKKQLLELAANNARQKLDELRVQWLNSEQRAVAALSELRDLLDLPALPQRIECYDISNTQGQQSVASMVVFERGDPKPSAYRRFKIKTVQGANDTASINEVIMRRFKRAAAELATEGTELTEVATEGAAGTELVDANSDGFDEEPASSESRKGSKSEPAVSADPSVAKWAELPDLLLIDGGRGQLNAALAALRELGFDHIPTIGVAKGVDRDRFDLVRPEQAAPIVLARDSRALNLVQRIDEEAHRFAITYHRKLRDKATFKSPLQEIPGIGPKRKKALLNHFGSIDALRAATVDEIAAVPGMTRKAAEELKGLL
jgi:excinuclease ABC subunit C